MAILIYGSWPTEQIFTPLSTEDSTCSLKKIGPGVLDSTCSLKKIDPGILEEKTFKSVDRWRRTDRKWSQ